MVWSSSVVNLMMAFAELGHVGVAEDMPLLWADILYWLGTLLLSVLAILLAVFSIKLVLRLDREQKKQSALLAERADQRIEILAQQLSKRKVEVIKKGIDQTDSVAESAKMLKVDGARKSAAMDDDLK